MALLETPQVPVSSGAVLVDSSTLEGHARLCLAISARTKIPLVVGLIELELSDPQLEKTVRENVLEQVALNVQKALRTADVVAFLDRKKMLVLLPTANNTEHAQVTMTKLRDAAGGKLVLPGNVKIGVRSYVGSVLVEGEASWESVLSDVRVALATAKLRKDRVALAAAVRKTVREEAVREESGREDVALGAVVQVPEGVLLTA